MKIVKALRDRSIKSGILRAVENLRPMINDNLARYPYIDRYAQELSEIKLEVAKNYDYWLEKAVKRAEEKYEVYIAGNGLEACKIIGEIVGSGKLVVKAKSMVSEEIGLRKYLESAGNEVWETDLGELIIQLADQKPMHVVAPALHLSEGEVIEIFKKIGVIGENAPELVSGVREFLRRKFMEADFGISGCNAFSIENARIFLVENEGNIRLVTSLPENYIALVTLEKLLPSDELALKSIIVQSAFVGTYPPTYINIPERENTHVIFLDNGRRDSELEEQLKCIKCGRCQIECPVYQVIGNIWGGETYSGPMGMGWSAITSSIGDEVFICSLCRKCFEVCPMKIDIPEIVRLLRRNYFKKLGGRT